ncbi:putative polyketide synthase [Tieghemostelium lacteum]|uniref:Putative polyketide synthase n=1 Tax=Tieghemostelium lacteum TaxID=361077 RepID=A0A151Z6R0_TIELA|nr:putative polyketide synthase [Tieghemostelium lacteum]|eukprot:KYQ89649.1 putative polyketide synthase [Tieghemostelium lacteum]
MLQNNIDFKDSDIAVIGIGCRFPGDSNSPKELWENITNKNFSGIVEVPEERWSSLFHQQGMISNSKSGLIDFKHWKQFDSLFFGISSKDSENIDPQQRILYSILWEALEDAHIKPPELRCSDTSVFIGSMNNDYPNIKKTEKSSIVLGTSTTFLSNALSFAFDLRGASMTLDTACSSSLNAIHLGCQTILNGQSQISICGGVNALLDPSISVNFSQLGILSKNGVSRPFDSDADGYIRGEGAGLVVLKKLSKAILDKDRIYCVIRGSCSNSDGQNLKNYNTQPSGQAQYENIVQTLDRFEIPRSDLFYVEAHGTSTPVGDPIEVEALSRIFKDHHSSENPLYIGSLKSQFGHTESASGVASLIKIAMMLKHRKLSPNINFINPNPKIDFDNWNIKVVTDLIDFPQNKTITVGLNSFGFGGSNCFMAIQEYQPINDPITTKIPEELSEYLIPFSVKSQLSFDKYIDEVIRRKSNTENDESFHDFVRYQCQSKDLNLQKRITLSCKDWNDLISKRNLMISDSETRSSDLTSIVYVFCGQGPQWKEMNDYLYQHNHIFRNSVQQCDNLMKKYFGYSILEKLRSIASDSNEIHHPIIAQPSLFLFQFGMMNLLKSWGIQPDAVVGHSFGEVTSALCSGIITLENAIKIVYFRSTLQQLTVGSGRLLSIGIGIDKYNELIDKSEQLQSLKDKIEIACFNSPDSIVLTSDEDNLKTIQNHLQDQGIFSSFLGTPCSFHSSKQESIRDKVIESLSDLPQSSTPKIPFFSTVTGQQMKEDSFYNNEYIYQNLRQPVRFNESTQSIYQFINDKQKQQPNSSTIFIEISPHPTLSFYIPQCIKVTPNYSINYNNNKITTLSLIHKKKSIPEQIQQTLSQLYFNGINLNFQSAQFQSEELHNSSFKYRTDWIPKYQWDSQEYWNAPSILRKDILPSANLLGKNREHGITVLETLIDLKSPAFEFLKGHVIKGKVIFPGCGYLDILLKQYPKQDLTIYNLICEKPCLISNDRPVIIQTIIQPTMTRSEFRVDFYCRDINNDKWTKTTHGRFALHSLDYQKSQFDIDKIRKECSFARLNKTEIYNRLAQLGLPYGPSFQRVKYMDTSSNSTFTVLDAVNKDKSFYFNAATLDSACHGLVSRMEPPQDLVFDRVQLLNYYPSNMTSDQPDTLYIYGVDNGQKCNSTTGTVYIINPVNGRSIIHMRIKLTSIVRIKHITPTGLFNIKYPSKEIFTYHWQPKESILSDIDHQYDLNNSQPMNMLNHKFNQLKNIKISGKHLIKILFFNDDDAANNNNEMNLNSIISIIESQLNDNSQFIIDITNLATTKNVTEINESLNDKHHRISIRNRTIQHGIESFDPEKEFIHKSNFDLIILPSSILKSMKDDNSEKIKSILSHLHNLLIPKGSLVIFDKQQEEELSINTTLISQLSNVGFSFNNQIQSSSKVSSKSIFCYKNDFFNFKQNNSNNNLIIIPSSMSITDNQKLMSNIDFIFNKQQYQLMNCNDFLSSETTPIDQNQNIFYYGINMNKENYIQISMEYFRIAQFLLKSQSKSKYILLTENFDSMNNLNYFNGSLIGCFRNLGKTELIDAYSINFDQDSIKSMKTPLITSMLDSNMIGCDKEIIIRNGHVQIQKLHQDDFKSNLYETDLNKLYLRCNSKLVMEYFPKPELQPFEYEVKVMAAGINFKDNMYYKGLLPIDMYPEGTDIYNPPIGLEFSGIVTRMGSKCTKFKIGERVIGGGLYTVASHVYEQEHKFTHLPDNISFVDGASVQITYLTSYYSLFSLVNIEEFDSILIHSASGGVGLSTLNLLKWKKYQGKIFVSVGSKEKEQYLRDYYGDMITDYYNSRTVAFGQEIIDKYGGVDIIINTLSGDFTSTNFSCLTKIGRIVDLSVTQLVENETLDLGQFRFSKAFIPFELWTYRHIKPRACVNYTDIILKAISKGELEVVPIKQYRSDQMKEAIEYIAESKHIGKLAINFENIEQEVISPMLKQFKENPKLSPIENQRILKYNYQMRNIKDTLLITGQSGVVIPVLKWILQRSPNLKNVIILSKSSCKWEIEWIKNCNKHIQFYFRQCDVSEKSDIQRCIENIQLEHSQTLSIKSVLHFAAVYDSTDFLEMNESIFTETHKPKAIGAINLHEISIEQQWNLDHFILFSSTSGFTGSNKQSHYNSANLLLDYLAEFRRSIGLNAVSINYGAMGGTGFVTTNKAIEEYLQSEGMNLVSIPKILGGLDIALQIDQKSISNFQCSNNDFVKMYYNGKLLRNVLDHLIPKPDQIHQLLNNDNITSEFTTINDSVQSKVIQMVSQLLSIEVSKLNPDIKLKDYGIDSLMTTQLKTSIEDTYEQTRNQFTHIQLISNSTNSISLKISNIINK